MNTAKRGIAGRIAAAFINSRMTPLIILASLLLGLLAVARLPREEEPQISVPMFDVFVPFPGASAAEVEERIINLGERKLWEIPGVEYIYSTAEANGAMFIVRFKVGTNPDDAATRMFAKVSSYRDFVPPGAEEPILKIRSIDDVPILALTFWNDTGDSMAARRAAAEVRQEITSIPNVSETQIIGGRRRTFKVHFNPERLAANRLTVLQVAGIIGGSNTRLPAGHYTESGGLVNVETDSFVTTAVDLGGTVVGISNGRPVQLRDVAEVIDGPDESEQEVYTAEAAGAGQAHPAVTLAVAKRKGANATKVADEVLRRVKSFTANYPGLHWRITRNYGETAKEKSDELLFHMLLATVSVTLLIALALGLRESVVVLVAIPVTLALTLLVYYLVGYTLNRITLFALIFSIGILVDDAIVVVENIHRHYVLDPVRNAVAAAIRAVDEVGNPTMLATLTVIAAILPLAFVGGLMGPYMRPIPVGASFAMVFSLAVAFIVSPWLFVRILGIWKPSAAQVKAHRPAESWSDKVYRRIMRQLLENGRLRKWYLISMVLLVAGAGSLVYFRAVRMKMLPFDNKSEFQVVINMPEGAALETTRKATLEIAAYLRSLPEADNVQSYIGTASPYNFNGLVRHYFLRNRPDQSDIQVNLKATHERKRQSHQIALSVRDAVTAIGSRYGARVHVSEVPPGPPVLSTLVVEIYGADPARLNVLADEIAGILKNTADVVDVDSYVPRLQPLSLLKVDRQKASLNGIAPAEVARTAAMALGGGVVGLAHAADEPEPVEINLRLSPELRNPAALRSVDLFAHNGEAVPVGALTREERRTLDLPIYHKNLQRTAYVIADVAGKSESPVYAILALRKKIDELARSRGIAIEQYYARQPDPAAGTAIKWDGEWQVTYEVFRDMGVAFAIVLLLIYVIVVAWFESFVTPLIIMAPIPLTLVGILPGHWIMNSFFTATSMIGFIAGAGIVVRNSIILVDFIQLRMKEGMPLKEAVIDAGAVRFKPMLLTAAAVMVGAGVILFDPIFQGLAISLIAGEVASTFLSRTAVPVLYYMVNKRKKAS